jgi:inhibitor of KinA
MKSLPNTSFKLIDYPIIYKAYGSRAILMEWPPSIDEAIFEDMLCMEATVLKVLEFESCILGYHSLLIVYRDQLKSVADCIQALQQLYTTRVKRQQSAAAHWTIPTCYDQEFGFDLQTMSEDNNISIAEIISLHTAPRYRVFFIGFLPGFLYLGGLDTRLAMPRKANPSLLIPKGSVAIGGLQTGIYPSDSEGGWNVIGNTPISFFDIFKEQPCFAKAGDTLSFEPISKTAYRALEKDILAQKFQLEAQ